MVDLRRSKTTGRLRRLEGLGEQGENTLRKLKEAIQKGDTELALALAEYSYVEGKELHDLYTDWVYANLDWIAKNYGEDQVPVVLRSVKDVLDKSGLFKNRQAQTSLADQIKMSCEAFRAHRSGQGETGDITVIEEPERFVLVLDPCGSGGRMIKGPLDASGSRVEPPFSLGKTQKPHNWSWGKAGVPYYCVHCCLWNEVIPIEKQGYPTKITECPSEDFSKPCTQYFYKDPDLIPERYFRRVGFKKDASRFKRQ